MKRLLLIVSTMLAFGFALASSPARIATEATGDMERQGDKPELTRGVASSFARLALSCVQKEYPNKPDHVINDERDVRTPKSIHPAFYGCFDWHSAVHGHWVLVRILRLFPDLPEAPEIRAALNQNLSRENMAIETVYLEEPNRRSFERTYGWAWFLKLAEELLTWDDPDARRWSENLSPLVDALVNRYVDFLPRQTYPIRNGVHPNTAFGIAFALDYAVASGDSTLRDVLIERSLAYYGGDEGCPAEWEPGGEDFFSPCLVEADLMRRVLESSRFAVWFERFLPETAQGRPANLFSPATVADRTDPKIVHLDGLNLSRAWCMAGVAAALPMDDPSRNVLTAAAIRHAEDALAHVASGHYEGEHWLVSFAVYMLSVLEENK